MSIFNYLKMRTDNLSLDELKELGAGVEAPEEVALLYRQAFKDFGARSLWNRKPSEHPTIAQALVIADNLRREGSMKTLPLAVQIEEACRAAI
ncbi:MAG: hypothetical protein HQK95_08355 [Nitrospirae bacterium]|nr:hypothetical protein [Nitrospirota bacterium]